MAKQAVSGTLKIQDRVELHDFYGTSGGASRTNAKNGAIGTTDAAESLLTPRRVSIGNNDAMSNKLSPAAEGMANNTWPIGMTMLAAKYGFF